MNIICRHPPFPAYFDRWQFLILDHLTHLLVAGFQDLRDYLDGIDLADFRVMEPKWLTNALYIIINQGQGIDKRGHGRIPKDSLRELLTHPTSSVLFNVDYSEQIDYILDVLRDFRLSYPFFDENDGEDKKFIPALCQNDSPTELELATLKPTHYSSISYFQLEYTFLPDSVLQRLMVQCYSDGCILSKSWKRGFCWKDKKEALTTIVTMDDSQQMWLSLLVSRPKVLKMGQYIA